MSFGLISLTGATDRRLFAKGIPKNEIFKKLSNNRGLGYVIKYFYTERVIFCAQLYDLRYLNRLIVKRGLLLFWGGQYHIL
jgi:hypothetical protein